MTMEVLKIVKFMIEFGFYQTEKEFRDLSIPLVALLDGTTDIYLNMEKKSEKKLKQNKL